MYYYILFSEIVSSSTDECVTKSCEHQTDCTAAALATEKLRLHNELLAIRLLEDIKIKCRLDDEKKS
jgi:hypothetical protein